MTLHSDTSHQSPGNSIQHSRSNRLRSRRKRSAKEQPRVDSFEQATRFLRMFHAHEAHSLDSILEHPSDDNVVNYDVPIFFPLARRLTKAKTMSCLSDLEERSKREEMGMDRSAARTTRDPPRIEEQTTMSITEYCEGHDEGEDDWEF